MARAKVYTLPGVERRDIAVSCPADHVLRAALKRGLSNVVVVGIDRKGEMFVAGSWCDVDKAVGTMMRGVQYLAGGTMMPLKGAKARGD